MLCFAGVSWQAVRQKYCQPLTAPLRVLCGVRTERGSVQWVVPPVPGQVDGVYV